MKIILNATPEQLTKLIGIVYRIRNLVNGKVYIGKSFHSFRERYGHTLRWWLYANRRLKNAVKKYGPENFTVDILAIEIKNDVALKKLETCYIKIHNSLHPHGYNLMSEDEWGGKVYTEDAKMQRALIYSNGKTYTIKEVATGELKTFSTLKEIKEKYHIAEQNLRALFLEKRRTINGIALPKTDTRFFNSKQKLYILIDQHGNEYECFNAVKFAITHNCCKLSIGRVIRQEQVNCYSKDGIIFSLKNGRQKKSPAPKINKHQKYKQIWLRRDSNIYIINIPEDLNDFCKKHNIHKRDIYALSSQEQKTAKGFKFEKVVLLDRSIQNL
jgi:group I intron endonuclease